MSNETTTATEKPKVICEKCEKEVRDVYECERCGSMFCDNCGAVYDQFTQIDFNCCKSCAKYEH